MLKLIAYSVAKKFPTVDNLTTSDLEDRIQQNTQDLIIIDSRRQDEYSVSHLKNAKHLHFLSSLVVLKKFIEENTDANKSTDIVCYCSLGYRSSVLVDKINKLELKNIHAYNLEGSIFKWANEDRPLEGADSVHPFSYLFGILALNWSKWQWNSK